MGKIPKRTMISAVSDRKPKIKKLQKNAGVTKASHGNMKLGLKKPSVPFMKVITKNVVADAEVVKLRNKEAIKAKKVLSKPENDSSMTKPNLKKARGPSMKSSKTKVAVETNSEIVKTKKVINHVPKILVPNDSNGQDDAVPAAKAPKRKDLLKKKAGATVELTKKKKTPNIIPAKVGRKKIQTGQKRKLEVIEDISITEATADSDLEETSVIQGLGLDEQQVADGVAAVLQLAKLEVESKNKLFDGEHQPIFLQVSCIKVPKVPKRHLRMSLPHSLVVDTDDVALFVKDLERGRNKDIESTVYHFQDFLKERGCTQVKDVIPMNQIRTEYNQYEMKKKLFGSYDYFLTDGRIAGHLSHMLGKLFFEKRKLPVSIRMESKDLKHEIDCALKKTSMQIHSHGNSHIIQVAHTLMPASHILDNILGICKLLAVVYPGGWDNIRMVVLKTSSSLAVPIYVTLKSKNKVKVPIVQAKRPKAHRTVRGELSTAPGNAIVVVRPGGLVTVRKVTKTTKKQAGESPVKRAKLNAAIPTVTKSQENENKKADSKKPAKNSGKKKEAKVKTVTAAIDLEDSEVSKVSKSIAKVDSEDEIEDAEQAYLSQWHQHSESVAAEEEPKKQKVMPTKAKKIIKKKKPKS